MGTSGFDTSALEKFQRDMEKAVSALGTRKVGEILQGATHVIEEQAVENASRISGKLQDSLKTRVSSSRGQIRVTIGNHRRDWSAGQGDKDYYPPYVEFGHSGKPAHPFLRPAYDQHKETVLAEIGQGIAQLLKDAGL